MKLSYVTVLSSDNYLPGVLALDKNVREKCFYPLLVVTPKNLDPNTYAELERRGISYIQADDIAAPAEALRATTEHAWYRHWVKSFFKLRVYDLTQYDKIVFIDCDMMLLTSIDDAFDYPDGAAVVAGAEFPGSAHWVELNSGLMVITPKAGLSTRIAALIPDVARKKTIFGDQDLIQAFFSDWKNNNTLHMPGGYNVYFEHYQFYKNIGSVKAVHFIGNKKPWMMGFFALCKVYAKCLLKKNIKGIPIFIAYRKLLREASR